MKNPQQLVLLTIRGIEYGNNWGGNAMSYPMYRDFSERNTGLQRDVLPLSPTP